jgi:AraC-like DNA-binding protein
MSFPQRVDLKGRLSNPLDIAETVAAQGSERIVGSSEGAETARFRRSDDHAEKPREEKGRLSNPAQRRLSPTDIDDLIKAYQAGATISQLAIELGIHRTTVAGHLDRHGVARHNEQTAWNDQILRQAAELYASGLSLADVADQFGVDAQTVANRFRRAGVAVRPRRGWTSPARSEREQH